MPSYVYDPKDGRLVESGVYYARKFGEIRDKVSDLPMPYVRGDLPTYTSPVTGLPVEGRAARREELKRLGVREVDPSEYKPVYKDYAFCQKRRLPYMGGDVPPPMSRDETAEHTWKRDQIKKVEQALVSGPEKTDPELAKFKRGNTKAAPIFKNNTVKTGD